MTLGTRESTPDGLTPGHPSAPTMSTRHLLGRLGAVEARVRSEMERRHAADPGAATDRFRGLYVSDVRAEGLLDAGRGVPTAWDPAPLLRQEDAEAVATAVASGEPLRLEALASRFGLAALDVELLLIALAPDVDPRFEGLFGYLNDDVSLRRATVGLALSLCGLPAASAQARARLGPAGPLVRGGLLEVEALERPQLTRTLRVPDRVVAHLLGDDTPDALVVDLSTPLVCLSSATSRPLERVLGTGSPTVYVRESRGSGGASSAAAAFASLGMPVVGLDLRRLDTDDDVRGVALAAGREAALLGGGLVAGPIEVLAAAGPAAVRAFAELEAPVVLVGREVWDPSWSREMPLLLEAERSSSAAQQDAWSAAVGDALEEGVTTGARMALFRLTPEQIAQAVSAARSQAAAAGEGLSLEVLERGARAQNAAGLQRLARRIEPQASFADLVLPASSERQLRELILRWQHRDRVLDDWGMGRGAARGRGVSALFAGPSGTGKTLSAEVIAGALALDLYVVDLSTVVDKYIGETSKNLERIFDEADRVNGVLLFDEADALFGKRSAVSDAKDRHANVEVAYLLQRMELFDGVAILTTNLAANLDEAFIRRLDAIIDFPAPDQAQRRALWAAKLTPDLPRAADIDLDLLAERFRLSGSEIRNVVVSAAYQAAGADREVTMLDLVEATVREHRKIARHLSPADLGEYRHLLGP